MPVFIDLEASALEKGYPIEVGWVVQCQPEEPDIESLRREIANVQRNVYHDHE